MSGRALRVSAFGVAALALFLIWSTLISAQLVRSETALLTTVTPIYGDEDLRPLIRLTIFDSWAPVLGADSPQFVVYDTGQVIYAGGVDDDRRLTYMRVELEPAELEALLDSLGVEHFYRMEDYYETVFKTDQRTETITVWTEDAGFHSVTVYGSLEYDPEARALAPHGFVSAFDRMMSYSHPDAEPWLPEMFEVLLWPYENSSAAGWPEAWPEPGSPVFVPRDQVISVYLDSDQLERYRELAATARAVRLDGETYAFSMRWPFPHEVVWPVNAAE